MARFCPGEDSRLETETKREKLWRSVTAKCPGFAAPGRHENNQVEALHLKLNGWWNRIWRSRTSQLAAWADTAVGRGSGRWFMGSAIAFPYRENGLVEGEMLDQVVGAGVDWRKCTGE